jgi:hypothetical protein
VEPSPHELLLNVRHGEIVLFVQVDENSVACSIHVSISHLLPCRKILDDRKAIVVYQTAKQRRARLRIGKSIVAWEAVVLVSGWHLESVENH